MVHKGENAWEILERVSEKAKKLIEEGKEIEGFRLYDQALQIAKEGKLFEEGASLCEFAARAALTKNLKTLSRLYFEEAYYFYQAWGNFSKTEELEKQYPQFLTHFRKKNKRDRQTITTTEGSRDNSFSETLDLSSLIKVSQTLSREIYLNRLLEALMKIMLENAGAEKGFLLLNKNGELRVEAEGTIDQVYLLSSAPMENLVPISIISYVTRVESPLLLQDALQELQFNSDQYLKKKQPKSILCLPIFHQEKLLAILYLENNLTTGVFTEERLEILKILSSQAAISIANAQLYEKQEASILLEKKAKEELDQVNRLKDDFLANTSHELRTPLNGITGIAESLIDGAVGTLPEKVLTNLSMIVASGKRLSSMVNDVLDFSKLKSKGIEIEQKPLSIGRVVDSVVALLKPLAENKQIEIKKQTLEHCPTIQGDENRLQQILYNLIGNAIKFTEIGKIEILAEQVGDFLEVTVQDTGIGIPKEKQEKIFESFEQVERGNARLYGGTGLGLPITKKLIHLHQGEIRLESEIGKGSSFCFTLPIASPLSEEIQPEEKQSQVLQALQETPLFVTPNPHDQEAPSAQQKMYRLLVVDDEPVNLQVISNQLSLHGYQVFQASSGQEAFDFLDHQSKPDLILLDVMMPKIDGLQVCKKIRERYSLQDLPILFLTAKNQMEDLIQGFAAGGNDYLMKPVSKEELFARVQTHLQLCIAQERLVHLRNFANQIGRVKSVDQLLEIFFQCLMEERFLSRGIIFLDEKKLQIFPLGETEENFPPSRDVFPLSQEMQIDSKGQDNFLLIQIEEFGNYGMILQGRLPFTDFDLEYILLLLKQTKLIQHNLSKLIQEPKHLSALNYIASNLSQINYIKSEQNYCHVNLAQSNKKQELLRITLSAVKLYFDEEQLLQVQRSYLINPNKVLGFQKKQKSQYEVFVGEENIPISSKYLAKLKAKFPQF